MTKTHYYYIILLLIGIGCFVAAIFSIKKEPRRIENGVLLTLFFCLVIIAVAHLISPDEYEPNGLVLLGKGSEALFTVFLILCLCSIFLGIFLCINGIKLIRKEGKISLAHLLPLGWGVFAIVWIPIFFLVLIGATFWPDMRYILYIFFDIALYIPLTLFSFLLYSILYACLPKNKDPDFIICLGCGLKNKKEVTPLLASRLNKAIQVYKTAQPTATIIVSGGKGADEDVSESHAMHQYLLDHGILESNIIEENQSLNTEQNLMYSKTIMDTQKKKYSSVFVTSNYHVLRASMIARSLEMETQGIGSKTAFYYLPAAFLREYIASMLSDKKLLLFYIILITLRNGFRILL